MIKRFYILSLVVLTVNSAFGQFIGRDGVSKALFFLQKNELDSAKKYIDEAEQDQNLTSQSKTWYYRGLIYKDLYKAYQKDDKTSPFRFTSVESLKKLLSIDTTKEFSESAQKMFNYLASTFYNDAARSLNPQTYKTSEEYYNIYKDLIVLASAPTDFTQQDIKFKLALASMLNQNLEKQTKKDSLKIEEVKGIYTEIIKLDSNNGSANYNIGILYYNESVDIINNMDYDMDLEELNRCQDVCTDLFLKALPYMLKSHELHYNLKETLIGLANIYHGLNDLEKEDFYKNELRAISSENENK